MYQYTWSNLYSYSTGMSAGTSSLSGTSNLALALVALALVVVAPRASDVGRPGSVRRRVHVM